MKTHMSGEHQVSNSSQEEGLPYPQNIELVGALQSIILDIEARDYQLTLEQEAAIAEVGHALLDGRKSGYIEMATSTGKTALEAIITEAAVKSGKRVLMLAPKVGIARQLSGKNQETSSGLARFTHAHQNARVGHHFGTSRSRQSDDIVIATYSGFLNASKNDFAQMGNFDVIIADECHRGLGEQTSRALVESFPDAVKLGFSATPDYAIDRTSEEVFGDRLFGFLLIEAIKAGRTAPIRALVYETDQELELFDNRGDFTERELAPLIENPERNGTAVQLARSFVADGRQGIVACIPGSGNSHARLLSELFAREGVCALDVGSHLGDDENIRRLHAFEAGEVKILLSTRMLEEGWDSNKPSFALNMSPTASPVRTKQILGRIMRRNPDGRESVYVDFVDKRRGLDKDQYTALHALELDTVEVDRILGRQDSSNPDWVFSSPLDLPHIREDVLQKLMQSNGRKLDDILLTHVTGSVDPLVRYWEQTLEAEGLPAEIAPNEMLGNRFFEAYDKVARRLSRQLGAHALTHDVVIAELLKGKDIPVFIKDRIATHGIKLSYEQDMTEDELTTDEPDPYDAMVRDTIHHKLAIPLTDSELEQCKPKLLSAITYALDSIDQGVGSFSVHVESIASQYELSPDLVRELMLRERGRYASSVYLNEVQRTVIAMRFGLPPYDREHTLDEIAAAVGKTRERIRQIESKSMAQLRHPSRSESLAVYYKDGPGYSGDTFDRKTPKAPLTFAESYEKHIIGYAEALEKQKQSNRSYLSVEILSPGQVWDIINKGNYASGRRRPFHEIERDLTAVNIQLAIPHEFYTLGYAASAPEFVSMRKEALHERIRYYQARIESLRLLRDDGRTRFQDSIGYLHNRIYTLQKANSILDHLLTLHFSAPKD